MNVVTLISQLINQQLDADAHAIDNWPNAVRKDGDAKWLHALRFCLCFGESAVFFDEGDEVA